MITKNIMYYNQGLTTRKYSKIPMAKSLTLVPLLLIITMAIDTANDKSAQGKQIVIKEIPSCHRIMDKDANASHVKFKFIAK